MVKPVLQNHPIAMKTRNFHENRENQRVFGVYEKTWIFRENLPNLWIRVHFADGVWRISSNSGGVVFDIAHPASNTTQNVAF